MDHATAYAPYSGFQLFLDLALSTELAAATTNAAPTKCSGAFYFTISLVTIPVFSALGAAYNIAGCTLRACQNLLQKPPEQHQKLQKLVTQHLHLAVMDSVIATNFIAITLFHVIRHHLIRNSYSQITEASKKYSENTEIKHPSSGTQFFLDLYNRNRSLDTTLHEKISRGAITCALLPAFAMVGSTFSLYLTTKKLLSSLFSPPLISRNKLGSLSESTRHLAYAGEDLIATVAAPLIALAHALAPKSVNQLQAFIDQKIDTAAEKICDRKRIVPQINNPHDRSDPESNLDKEPPLCKQEYFGPPTKPNKKTVRAPLSETLSDWSGTSTRRSAGASTRRSAGASTGCSAPDSTNGAEHIRPMYPVAGAVSSDGGEYSDQAVLAGSELSDGRSSDDVCRRRDFDNTFKRLSLERTASKDRFIESDNEEDGEVSLKSKIESRRKEGRLQRKLSRGKISSSPEGTPSPKKSGSPKLQPQKSIFDPTPSSLAEEQKRAFALLAGATKTYDSDASSGGY